ncbi:hypothetical protein CROQUDRAFT_87966 [Cronartium quercuum f. sp. fusiforme G11]|uniref:Uncharacterized protein n=1 Tax=Cronartium quercuum f. sp. fusiforme G11 TaxID=708437 RepID=A0A9P6TG73_9BASI|nr:hypothetical protein CROQUDRAFT_87966 [Cronartium quercuum f. sp. fusiforme G11]
MDLVHRVNDYGEYTTTRSSLRANVFRSSGVNPSHEAQKKLRRSFRPRKLCRTFVPSEAPGDLFFPRSVGDLGAPPLKLPKKALLELLRTFAAAKSLTQHALLVNKVKTLAFNKMANKGHFPSSSTAC